MDAAMVFGRLEIAPFPRVNTQIRNTAQEFKSSQLSELHNYGNISTKLCIIVKDKLNFVTFVLWEEPG
jgi:hypothetical protein